jgi:DNA-binding MarR family transcriptional regulator
VKNTPEYLLHRLVYAMDKVADRILVENFAITYNRFRFIAALQNSGELTQHALAVLLGYSDPAVSKMLIELSKEGYVTIKTDPEHGRKRLVSITSKASKLAVKGQQLLHAHFTEIMKKAKVDSNQYAISTKKILDAMAVKMQRQ